MGLRQRKSVETNEKYGLFRLIFFMMKIFDFCKKVKYFFIFVLIYIMQIFHLVNNIFWLLLWYMVDRESFLSSLLFQTILTPRRLCSREGGTASGSYLVFIITSGWELNIMLLTFLTLISKIWAFTKTKIWLQHVKRI